MSKHEHFNISTSNIIALWQLIILTTKHEEIPVKSAIEIVLNSTLLGGNIPAENGLKLGQHCKLLDINNACLFSSQYCKDEIIAICNTEEPNLSVVRAILYRYTSFNNLDWLLFFNDDPEIFKIAIPEPWIELLEQADLFDFDNSDVREWWGKVFSKFQTYKEGQKIEIGKVAEKLTFEYEQDRLKEDGLDHGYSFVRWASQINDKYGYDVSSIRGTLLKYGFSEKETIQIEVKCSVASDEKVFRFYVSKNEWNVAKQNIESYYFYCWTTTNMEMETAVGPYILAANILAPHFPTDNGNLCEWSETRFIVNLNDLTCVQL